MLTLAAALTLVTYLVAGPARWLADAMELTYLSPPFKAGLVALAAAGFAAAYAAETRALPALARALVRLRTAANPKWRKRPKAYKAVLQSG